MFKREISWEHQKRSMMMSFLKTKKTISHYDDVDAKAVNFLGEKKIKIEEPDGDSYT